MMFKFISGHVDVVPSPGTLTKVSRFTRGHKSKILVPYSRTDAYLFSFFPSGIRVWNALPSNVTSAVSVDAFKNSIDSFAEYLIDVL